MWISFNCVTANTARKEGIVLFNDALNTFYLLLYGILVYMVKDHSYSERGNLLPPHGLYAPSHRQDNTYHGLYYTSHGALAGTRNTVRYTRKVIVNEAQYRPLIFFMAGGGGGGQNIKYVCVTSWKTTVLTLDVTPTSEVVAHALAGVLPDTRTAMLAIVNRTQTCVEHTLFILKYI